MYYNEHSNNVPDKCDTNCSRKNNCCPPQPDCCIPCCSGVPGPAGPQGEPGPAGPQGPAAATIPFSYSNQNSSGVPLSTDSTGAPA